MAIGKVASNLASFVDHVERVFHQYWGGQFEVVTVFFSRPRSVDDLVAWLEAQAHKEIQSIPRQAQAILDMYRTLDDETERGELQREAYEMADEIQHYRLLADVLEMVSGRRRPARELTGSKSPESMALREVRATSRELGRLANLVGAFGGPGGGAAFSAAGMMIDGGPVERQLASAFAIIHEQELHHYQSARFVFDQQVHDCEATEIPGALDYARSLARAHFLERNALFGYPLSPERIVEIDSGLVRPYQPRTTR